MREAFGDTFLQDVTIPRGTKVMISSCATNTDQKLWRPDANELNHTGGLPRTTMVDGMLLMRVVRRAIMRCLPFLKGRRSCIWQTLARAEFSCLLAAWVFRFEFWHDDTEKMPINRIEIGDGITAKPPNGHATLC